MVNETRSAIYRGFTFLLEIDGIVRAGFRECSGLDTSQDPIDYRVGVEPATARTLPGEAKPSVISLEHGITGDAELWEWRHNATRDQVDRRNGSIVLVDAHGKHQARWNFRSGWPVQWIGPSSGDRGGAAAIEALDIAYEDLGRA